MNKVDFGVATANLRLGYRRGAASNQIWTFERKEEVVVALLRRYHQRIYRRIAEILEKKSDG